MRAEATLGGWGRPKPPPSAPLPLSTDDRWRCPAAWHRGVDHQAAPEPPSTNGRSAVAIARRCASNWLGNEQLATSNQELGSTIRFVQPVLSPSESARLDAESTTPVEVLMERAGLGVALAAIRMGVGYGSRVTVLAGPGNNGGDGYVAARYLASRGVGVEILALAEPRTGAAIRAAERLGRVPVRRLGGPNRKPDLVIDALFGGGFRRGVPDEVRPWAELDVPKLAVDVPSGLDPATGIVDDVAFAADRTVTFHSLKTGHLLGSGPDVCGTVDVVDIGLEGGVPELLLVEDDDAVRPPRERTAHKWSAGSVLVMGGAEGMVGAAVFAARAALSFGAGAVGVASPSLGTVQALAPEVLGYPRSAISDRYRVIVVGPGMGEDRESLEAAMASERSLVIDADALGLLPVDVAFERPTVLTPHAGEFRRLTGDDPSPDAAGELARRSGAVVLLKGNPTFVTDGAVPRVVTSGGPELATIGTGDVLAGMIGALLARGLSPLDAATSAAHWHGVAARDLAGEGTVTADRLAGAVRRHAWSGS